MHAMIGDDTAVAAQLPFALRVANLHKAFGSLKVLQGVTLNIPRGQQMVIMGPSGCGKSVLLRSLIGLERIDRGEVHFGSQRIDTLDELALRPIRLRVGFLFQQSALFDSLSVRENVGFPLVEHGMVLDSEVDDRVHTMLRLVGLEDKLNEMPATLSGGQRKRVALARAIVLHPEVIMYDEPTTGLDPITADLINELILKLASELGITSVIVTHDLASAFKVGNRIVMLHDGVVRHEADTASFGASSDPVVIRFLKGEANPEELAEINRGHGSDTTTATSA